VLVADTQHGVSRWQAEHDGYRPAVHRRSVELDDATRELRVTDEVTSARRHPCRLVFHLGPRITADLVGATAHLSWTAGSRVRNARLELPAELSWSVHRGETGPPLGWYSPGFGRKEPACTLLGTGLAGGDLPPLRTLVRFTS
jgi:hypothetical protein